ncbi:hypothetical protein IQ06DRAFT_42083 [Phaeosphaeriaceae sp. SRC1lsM3a]|nr:hypothetical protein IQ06DRAFT_42083 [Stagonospora sp. SRC1lsM3a]
MPSTNLIVALVFAALFGAGLVFLSLYIIYSYVRKRCLELDHWFHLLTPKQLRSPCRHCEGTGRDVREKSRSRSSQRKSRSRSRVERGRSQQERVGKSFGQSMNVAEMEWNAISPKGQLRGGGQGQLSPYRQALPAAPAMQSTGITEHYNAWQWSSPRQYTKAATYPQPYPQAFQLPHMKGGPQMESYAPPAPSPLHPAIPVPSSALSMPPYQKPPRKAPMERSEAKSRSKPRQAPNDSNRVRTTNYIHIVDEYPPLVKEAIRKAAMPPAPAPSMLSSSISNASTESIEELPRVSIPQAIPRPTDASPFAFPQYPHLATRAWNAPTAYP